MKYDCKFNSHNLYYVKLLIKLFEPDNQVPFIKPLLTKYDQTPFHNRATI